MDISTKPILGKNIVSGKILKVSCYTAGCFGPTYKPLVVLKTTRTPIYIIVLGLMEGIIYESCYSKWEGYDEYC